MSAKHHRLQGMALGVLKTCLLISLISIYIPALAQTQKKLWRSLHPKVSTSLQLAGQAFLQTRISNPGTLSTPLVKINEAGEIEVNILLDEITEPNILRLVHLGAKVEFVHAASQQIQARVPLAGLFEIADQSFVARIRQPDYAVSMSGAIITEGDTLLKAREIRLLQSVNGSSVRVGVISDGVDSRASSQATQDLPMAIDINSQLPGSGDEGTAMLEIIHDLAPGASLAFSAANTDIEMLAAIEYLAYGAFGGQGCDIIVDDLGFLGEPFFEDGNIASLVSEVVANGRTYITAAGNQAQAHYEDTYSGGRLNINGVPRDVHDFGRAAGGASDVSQSISIGGRGKVVVILQWNDTHNRSNNDYDLLIMDNNLGTILARSEDQQTGLANQFAFEAAAYENPSHQTVRVNVVIRNMNASPRLLEMHYTGEDFSLEQYNIENGSVVPGQQSCKDAIAVGAINVRDPGADDIQSYSSRGPAEIFYPSPETRIKPDITAVDGTLITGAGGFGLRTANGSRFYGTSAAAPHVAGVAALLLSGNSELTPAQIRSALEGEAVDLGQTGRDNVYGAGRVDAFASFKIAIAVTAALPGNLQLEQNYPNPFNIGTSIRFKVQANSAVENVKLEIYNALGQRVATLFDGPLTATDAETVSFQWNGIRDNGERVASGVYFCRLRVGSSVQAKKMILLK